MARTSRVNIPEEPSFKMWNTALYIRLSREDGDKEESDSIGNQRSMLTAYVEEHPEFKLYDIYIDDGYTGTNFKRPDFERMVADMKKGLINCIIVKDLSRFGRDYIGVGDFQENVFPLYDLRFIALNDRIDTHLYQDESQSIIVPFKNIFNEQYARDISKKVRSALDTKRKNGEFIGSFACYGYMKDPKDKNHLTIDEEVAENVRNIFKWFIAGMPKLSIATKLNQQDILCPSEYKKQKGLKYINPNRLASTVYWTHTSVHRILKSEIYAGNMVQHTQTQKSFKIHKNIQLDKSEWIVVENTHEAIIDKETWDTTQRLLKSDIKKSQYTGEVHLFAGLIRCADCGRAMKKRINHNGKYEYYICGTYMTYGKEHCDSHSIRIDELTDLVYKELKTQIDRYANFEVCKSNIEERKQSVSRIESIKQSIKSTQQKLEKARSLKQGLYEDYKAEVLSKEEYFQFKSRYDSDIEKYEQELSQMQKSIANADETDEFKRSAALLAKYKDMKELDREAVVSLIEYIKVHSDKTITIKTTFEPLHF